MTTAHTATPWAVFKGYDGSIDVAATKPHRINNISAGTPIICTVFRHEDAECFSGEANAEFIVRACNAYAKDQETIDDLVKALEDAMRLLELAGYTLEGTATGRMKAAIAKAKGSVA